MNLETLQLVDTTTRLLPIQGAYNVRDLGGYKTKDGRQVKWGKVIRSGDLNHLTDSDLLYFSRIPLKSYIDFRDSAEIAAAPDKYPPTVTHLYKLPILAGDLSSISKLTPESALSMLGEMNKEFVKEWQPVYADFFKILMEEDNSPLLFHCSAGKDRTGYAAALFLSSLGVDRETIIQDYMLSAEYLKDKYAREIKAYPVLAPLMTVKREYIEAAFNLIDQEYGGMENYLTNYLYVDLEKMKNLYLE